jgi:DNA polymerase I
MDIKSLLKEDGFICKYIANTYGGTFASPCPWCGGKDRFRCFPNNGNGGNYLCQKCGKKGTVLRYLTEYRGMEYSAAIALSGITTEYKNTNLRSRLLKKDNKFKEPSDPPCNKWQQQASELIQVATENIWHPENVGYLDWLMKRGLTASTIRKYNIGYNCADIYYDRSVWGITDPNNSSNKMIVPAGIIIPHINNDVIQKIKIRCSDPQAKNKYHLLAGSNNSVMVLGFGSCHIVVESELDGILLEQEAGDLVTIIVLGSAQNRPDVLIMKQLVNSDLVLLALDNDRAGVESSYDWWMKTLPNTKRWPVLNGKDPGEAFQNGVNIRNWIQAGILSYDPSGNVNLKQNRVGNNQSDKVSDKDIKRSLAALAEIKDKNAVFVNIITTGNDPFNDSISEIHLSDSGNFILKIKGDDSLSRAKAELEALFSKDSCKIFYGAKSQLKFLIKQGFKVNGPILDQKIAKKIIHNGTMKIDDRISIEQMKIGNKSIVEELKTNNLGEVFQLEMDCLPVIAQMELNGMLTDKIGVNNLLNDLKKQLIPIEKILHDYFGHININSSQQLKNACNLEGIQISDTKKEMLIPLVKDHPILQAIIDYRRVTGHINKCKEILKNIDPNTERIHPQYNQVVDTGRMSCSHPNIHGIPKLKKFRSLFVAPEGSKIIRADFSQIELRVAAEISGDSRMINAFSANQDLHKLTASLLMDKPIKDISDSERQRAKAVNFGLLYGMSAKSLQTSAINSYGVYLSLDDAEKFRLRFYSSYQGFARWQQLQLYKTETRTLSDRRRIWKNQLPKPTQLFNSPIQGTAADILKKSLVFLSDNLIECDTKIIGTIHDEILVETPNKSVATVKIVVENSMIKAGEFYLRSVPVKVDVTDAATWR